MNSFQIVKKQVESIASETVSMGNSIAGSYERAADEFWLEPLSINSFGPSYLVKFQAALAILKFCKNSNLSENHELKEIAMYLLGKLSDEEINGLEESAAKELISDSMEIFENNWYIIHSIFKKTDG